MSDKEEDGRQEAMEAGADGRRQQQGGRGGRQRKEAQQGESAKLAPFIKRVMLVRGSAASIAESLRLSVEVLK